jgi:hypothetical protein
MSKVASEVKKAWPTSENSLLLFIFSRVKKLTHTYGADADMRRHLER